MNRLQEYHWRGMDLPHLTGAVLILLGWGGLFAVARVLPPWQMFLLIGAVALMTAALYRNTTRQKQSGAWITQTHLNVYYGHKHWAFPLSGIKAIGARSAPFYTRAPHLELSSGRKVNLPLTCLPTAPELRRWMKDQPIRVDANITMT